MNDQYKNKKIVLGIDLGTTNTCIAIIEAGKYVIIPDQNNSRTTASAVYYKDSETSLVGEKAKNSATVYPNNTIQFSKRAIGKKYSELTSEQIKSLPFKCVSGKEEAVEIAIPRKGCDFSNGQINKSPIEVASLILNYVKNNAINYLGLESNTELKAVITVPAYFTSAEKDATRAAGLAAGLDVIKIINEPTAAALAYGVINPDGKAKDERNSVAVFDLGGGTFDVSILDIKDGVFHVSRTGGDVNLGGLDFDNKIYNYLKNIFENNNNITLNPSIQEDAVAISRLKAKSEEVKHSLSQLVYQTMSNNEKRGDNKTNLYSQSITVQLTYLGRKNGKDLHLNTTLTVKKFKELIDDLINKTIIITKDIINKHEKENDNVSKIILVGGMTKLPFIKEALKETFPNKEICSQINPDESVASGAALQGNILTGSNSQELLLIDVVPMSLGIKVEMDEFSVIIPEQTAIPVIKTATYTTSDNNQKSVNIEVYQGASVSVSRNKLLGKFILSGIQDAPRGVPKIEVTFDVSTNGILKVTACDKQTSQKHSLTVENSSQISSKEIEEMKKNADKFNEFDKAKNQIMSLKHEVDNLMSDNKTISYKDFKEEYDTFESQINTIESLKLEEIKTLLQKYTEFCSKLRNFVNLEKSKENSKNESQTSSNKADSTQSENNIDSKEQNKEKDSDNSNNQNK